MHLNIWLFDANVVMQMLWLYVILSDPNPHYHYIKSVKLASELS